MNTHQYNKHPGTFKAQKIIVVYFCLSIVNISPKSGGEQTKIELDPPPPSKSPLLGGLHAMGGNGGGGLKLG